MWSPSNGPIGIKRIGSSRYFTGSWLLKGVIPFDSGHLLTFTVYLYL